MKILLSNDDGYFAPGIQTVFKMVKENLQYTRLDIVAPERNRSAASNSLTLLEPLRMSLHSSLSDDPKSHVYSVNGTPTDCVHLGMNGGLGYQPDIVLSGINAGANMGDDVLYSGTVAAATEGRFLGKPSIAISLCGDQYFDTAASVLLNIINELPKLSLTPDTIININVPDIPLEQLKGIKVTRLGKRHISEPVVKETDPRGLPIFWIGPAGSAADAGEGTDFYAVEQGYASITPLKIDLTHYEMMERMHAWEKGLSIV
ncbi:5'/3'-nucleotidase SurE [Thiomicrorhabdus sp.]|uniref:5'/3'-nucleotidase SurE n=1 Tax=Thiomicrorhabdus sp. TaxID=2039724 RepID=UPI002AA89226|nr:5'/3'-nucleotidase SurE [Thiomicrorhabdus sp.]